MYHAGKSILVSFTGGIRMVDVYASFKSSNLKDRLK